MKAFYYLLLFTAGCVAGATYIYKEGYTDARHPYGIPVFRTFKVKIIENGSVTYVYSPIQKHNQLYVYGDTVWVNLEDHLIDDTDTTAMLGIIIKDTKL